MLLALQPGAAVGGVSHRPLLGEGGRVCALLAILIDKAADQFADADVEPSGLRLQES
jgi:hypothetical protein